MTKLLSNGSKEANISKRLDEAKENLKTFNFIGITEEMDKILFTIKETYGWEINPAIRLNNHYKTRRLESLSEKERLFILKNNWADLQLYEYAKNIAEQRFKAFVKGKESLFENFKDYNPISIE